MRSPNERPPSPNERTPSPDAVVLDGAAGGGRRWTLRESVSFRSHVHGFVLGAALCAVDFGTFRSGVVFTFASLVAVSWASS